jgi:hypothetical protein
LHGARRRARSNRDADRGATAFLLVLLFGCALRAPRVTLAPLADGLDAFLATHPLADG